MSDLPYEERLFSTLAAARSQQGSLGSLKKEAWLQIVRDFHHAETIAKKRRPKGAPRARNPLWDALALSTGSKHLDQITRQMAKGIGVALADILAVTADCDVEEIERRAAVYKRRHPTWTISAQALAKHWGEFGRGEMTRTAKINLLEPSLPWQDAARAVAGKTFDIRTREGRLVAIEEGYSWIQFSDEFRLQIIEEMQRT